MIVRGKVIHWYDCFVCKHHVTTPILKKGRKPGQICTCGLTGITIVAPYEGKRWCDCYQNKGCECPSCTAPIAKLGDIFVIQLDNTLDRIDVLC